ncbi:conserved hypothetical protein [Talaromyces stipitatus ATCC 10500]|uniref:Uncharacterized protein n=1 Tax=Talaromyces stipitatus (strain ATCC 10500 / CBS 375.48 / QM 6759 / NRRL 1006) TaxID=441959 RepID=B8MJF9_TALSN|nr:uncharacterized protein TSTA_046130 [Talaromyces stipitatus ATCC 10500]EED15159.1 conserved hypothetical protein [Talaromyces stipitatus ATCC 10500]
MTLLVSNEADIELNENFSSETTPEIDSTVQKSLVRRRDLILLPTLCNQPIAPVLKIELLRPRANLRNAKSAILEQDLNSKGNRSSLLLMMFYIPYSIFSIPATILAKIYSSAVVIPLLVLGRGRTSVGLWLPESFWNDGSRIFALGECLFVKFLYQGVVGEEIICVLFNGSAISGPISWGVFQWHRNFKVWQYLFLIEGAIIVSIAFIALMTLPHSVQGSRYFTPFQKKCASVYLKHDKKGFIFHEGFIVLKGWKIWLFALSGLLYGVGSSSTSNFLPVMIKRRAQDTVRVNLYTIGPNLTGALMMMYVSCWVTDRM